MLDVGQLISVVLGGYFLLLAGFAAITTAQALEEDDREGLTMRVFWSLTKTTLFLGLPALLGGLLYWNSSSSPGENSGMMSKDVAMGVVFVFGALGLLGLWVGSITLGFVGSAIVRNLRPTVGAGVLFLIVSGAPVFMAMVTAATAAQNRVRNHR